VNFRGSFPHPRQSIVASSFDRFREAIETDPLILDVSPEDAFEIKIFRYRRALGVNARVRNRLKADLKYVLADTGMEWPRSLVCTNRDNTGTKWYLVNCGSQCVFDVFFGGLFSQDIEDGSCLFVGPGQPIFQEPEDSSCLRDIIYRFGSVFSDQVTPLQRLQQSIVQLPS
jgi:hypothetical protein